MANIKVKQIKSTIGRPETQIKTLKSLGLGRIGKIKELPDIPVVRGQIEKVKHLVEIA